jgi:RHS repeat-associated protein
MILDKTGSLSAMTRHDYLPFGEEVYANTGLRTTTQGYTAAGYSPADKARQKFTAQERDDETGLDFMHARYHSSTQGRFTSVDPLSGHPVAPQSWNGYAYVGNSPLNATDPTGMSSLSSAHVGKGGEYIADFYNDAGVYGGEDSWERPKQESAAPQQQPSGATTLHEAGHAPAQQQQEATPVNFTAATKVIPGDPEHRGDAGLFGSYLLVTVTWQSSTGKLDDLARYQFREKLEYPPEGTKKGVYTAPDPFNFSNTNPSYGTNFSMKEGGVTDRHSGFSVLTPYKTASFTVTQTYQYSKDGKHWVDVPTTISITRSISQETGIWQQRITNSLNKREAIIALPPKGFYQF